jgi:hypothetical protein
LPPRSLRKSLEEQNEILSLNPRVGQLIRM